MKFLVDYWPLLLILFAAIIVGYTWVKKFAGLPSEAQQAKIKEFLLYAVIMAEKEFKDGTGALKLRYVYSLFMDKYPSLVPVVPFEMFSAWVDEVLVQMKHLLETNADIASYVMLDEKEED